MTVFYCLVPLKRRQIVLYRKVCPFYRSIYVTKVIKLLAFIFEQPSYMGGPKWRYRLTAEHCDCHFIKQNALINNLNKQFVPC